MSVITYSTDYLSMSLLYDNFEAVVINGHTEYKYTRVTDDSAYYLPKDVHNRRQAIRAKIILGLLNPIQPDYTKVYGGHGCC